jgi:hypothetical protein
MALTTSTPRLPFLLPGMVVIAWSQDGQKKKRSPWPALIASIGNWKKCNEATKNHSPCVFLCRFLYGRFEAQLAKTSAFGLFSHDAISAGHIEPFPDDAQTCRVLCKRFIEMKTLSGSFSSKFSAQAFEAGWVEAAQLACGLDFSLTDIDDGGAAQLLSGGIVGSTLNTTNSSQKIIIRPEIPSLPSEEVSNELQPILQNTNISTTEVSIVPVLQNTPELISANLPLSSSSSSSSSSLPPPPPSSIPLNDTSLIPIPSEIYQRIMNYIGPVGYPISLNDVTCYSRFAQKGGIILRDRQVLILRPISEESTQISIPTLISIQTPRSNTRRRALENAPEKQVPTGSTSATSSTTMTSSLSSSSSSSSPIRALRLILAYEFHVPVGVPLPENDEEIAYADDDEDDYHSRMKRVSSPKKEGGGGTSPSSSTSQSPSADRSSTVAVETVSISPFDKMNEARLRQCFVRGVSIVELSKSKPNDKTLIDTYGAGFVKPGFYMQVPMSDVIGAAPPQSYTFLKEEFDKIFKINKAKMVAEIKAHEAAAEEAKAAAAKEAAWGGKVTSLTGIDTGTTPQSSVLQSLIPGGRVGTGGGGGGGGGGISDDVRIASGAISSTVWDPSRGSMPSSSSSIYPRKNQGPPPVLLELVQSQLLRAANSDSFPIPSNNMNNGQLVFPAAQLVGEGDQDVFDSHTMMRQKRPRTSDDIDINESFSSSSSSSSFPYYSDEAVVQRAKITSGFATNNDRIVSQSCITGVSTSHSAPPPSPPPPRLNLLEEQFKVAYAAAVAATDPDPYTTARRSIDHLLPEYAKFANVGQAPLGGWIANTSRKHYAEILKGAFLGPELESIINSNGGAVIKPDGTGFVISETQLAQMKAQNLLKTQAQLVADKKPIRAVKPASRLLAVQSSTTRTTKPGTVVSSIVSNTRGVGFVGENNLSSSL